VVQNCRAAWPKKVKAGGMLVQHTLP